MLIILPWFLRQHIRSLYGAVSYISAPYCTFYFCHYWYFFTCPYSHLSSPHWPRPWSIEYKIFSIFTCECREVGDQFPQCLEFIEWHMVRLDKLNARLKARRRSRVVSVCLIQWEAIDTLRSYVHFMPLCHRLSLEVRHRSVQ